MDQTTYPLVFFRNKPHFSGVHFWRNIFRVCMGFYITRHAPILRKARVCEISCWNYIRVYNTELKPWNLICWQFLPIHYAEVLSWKTSFNLGINEDDFRYQLKATNSSNLTDTFNFIIKKRKYMAVIITLNRSAGIGRKITSGLIQIM